MKKLLLLSILALSISAHAQMSFETAQGLACAEAARVNFYFEESCEEALFQPLKTTRTAYTFFGQDDSGDCGIAIKVQRKSGKVISKVDCN